MTILLDKAAFRHFTPKEMHEHLKLFDAFLVEWSSKDAYINTLVEQPFGVYSIKDRLPIVHVTALLKDGKWRYFHAPADYYSRKDGHRFVTEHDSDIIGMQPTIRFEVVLDPALTTAFNLQTAFRILEDERSGREKHEIARLTELAKNTERPAVLFSAPWAMLKKGTAQKFLAQRFTLYQHIIGAGHEYPEDGLFYIGITARDWKRRWAEHRAAISRGSRLKFHRAYGDRVLERKLTFVHHKVMGVAATLNEVQDLEEVFVGKNWHDERLLNMIPGGKAGIAYLHQHGMLAKNVTPVPDCVESTLEKWLRDHPRKGLPAPWVSDKWKDDEYALKVICGAEGRLSIQQVLDIRLLASGGMGVDEITARVGAKNREQVQRVISGQTYSRVKLP